MSPQEAYVKGLDDAENRVIANINKYLESKEYDTFVNPALEEVWKKLIKTISPATPEFYCAEKIQQDKKGLIEVDVEYLLMKEVREEDTAVDIFAKKVNLVNENSEKELKKASSGNKKSTKSKGGVAKL
jgi:hypothetical protein